jgi:hypothetical protein
MKKFSILFFSILFTLNLSAHPFYFSYTEIEYNEFCNCFEGFISLSSDDFEEVLNEEKNTKTSISKAMNDSLLKKEISKILNMGLSFSANKQEIQFQLEGYETEMNGLTRFYFKTEPFKNSEEILIEYDLFMNKHPEQQNKLTLIQRNKKETFEFLIQQKTKLITIEP